MTTANRANAVPGSISHGTLRACDLASAYMAEIERQGLTLDADCRQLLTDAASRSGELVADAEPEEVWEALAKAEELLGETAPFGHYFGAHAGDGSDIGYWLTEEWADALTDRCIDESDWEQVLAIAEDEGIEPDSLCDAWQGEVGGITEELAGAEYAQQLAEDCGMVDGSADWPLRCIDWRKAWIELSCDGFSLHELGRSRWAVIRSC